MDFLYYKFDELGLFIAIILGSLLMLQILYFIIVYGRVGSKKKKTKVNNEKFSVSVVICVQSESKNLEEKLPIVLEQEYPNFEVVIVNEDSEENSYNKQVLRALSQVYSNLQIVNIPNNINYFQGKKFPISLGIKTAKNDIIILTDDDTMPTCYTWIDEIVERFTKGKEIVIGYTAIETKKGLLNSLIQYDNHTIALNYLGNAILGNPYMGRGKNLAFKRDLFFRQGGYISHYVIPVGEDDIFINKVSTKKNTNFVLSKDSINLCKARVKYRDFKMDKKKLILSQKHFKLIDRFIIDLIPFTTFLIYLLFGFAIYINIPWQYLITALIIRFSVQIIIYYRTIKALGTKKIAIFAPLFELFFMFYNTIIRINTLTSKGKKWN
ncbi:MAG: glycosyltransferase [Bacteroidales bacterium]|jgi:glycosyltransferase involved in cell wall biosynthesis|nr:glycosyltransferase [Bacteroidales bacterium]